MQRTGSEPYVQRHLPTGGVEIHFPIGGRPRLLGPLTGPQLEVISRAHHSRGRAVPTWYAAAAPDNARRPGRPGRGSEELRAPGGPARGGDGPGRDTRARAENRAGPSAARIPNCGSHGSVVEQAVHVLMPWKPVDVETVATHLALSTSQLRRRCLQAVGVARRSCSGRCGSRASSHSRRPAPRPQVGAERTAWPGWRSTRVRRPGAPQPRMPAPDRTHPAPVPRRRRGPCACGHEHSASYGPSPGHPGRASRCGAEPARFVQESRVAPPLA